MTLLTEEQRIKLRNNGRFNATRSAEGHTEIDFMPIVKLYTPWGGAMWLLSELDPEDQDIAFGLCDLGDGFPELGCVRLSELESMQGPKGLRIERDDRFRARKSLGGYADEARIHQRVIA